MAQNTNQLPNGMLVKTKFSFMGKNKGRDLWKAGVVIDCYTHFAVIKFEHFKKSFAYDEIEVINEMEWQQLRDKNMVRQALIFESVSH
ncbi:hypothetical protein [Acetobacterium wieringae]|uniref:hypothetical protein n=1 Tax=Acetobacterium wieringae TaxID=52694 RepID=UPI002B208114|nr:hypothetical protein [Acetobacterium wieringae]MEA4805013.1 hypothetical protein [Acetobacterium wieringae]